MQFAEFLDRHEAYFPPTFTRPSFLDNHDMNRFLWVARGDIRKLKLAALCQFTLTGAPVIYYGTEVGLSQQNDVMQNGFAIHEEARLPMLWGEQQDRDLFSFYKELIALRKSHPALRSGTRKTLHADEKIFAYRRSDGEENLVTVLNISNEEASVELELVESALAFATSLECRIQGEGTALSSEAVSTLAPARSAGEGGKMRLILPPFAGMVLTR